MPPWHRPVTSSSSSLSSTGSSSFRMQGPLSCIRFDPNRVALWWRNIPLACRWLFGLCTVVTCFFGAADTCLSTQRMVAPSSVVGFLWSFVLSVFKHGGFLHWLMNMVALLSLGPDLELSMGTCAFAWLMLILGAVSNTLFLFFEWAFTQLAHVFSGSCVVGCSGLLFALMMFEAWTMRGDVSESLIFGFIAVPRRWAPVVWLFILGLLLPGSSFVMHLCGVVSGFALAVLLSSRTWAQRFLKLAGECGRDSICSRCRHFEDAPVETASSHSSSYFFSRSSGEGTFPALPVIAPPCKSFEAFSGSGRRLGGTTNISDASTAAGSAPAAVTVEPSYASPADGREMEAIHVTTECQDIGLDMESQAKH